MSSVAGGTVVGSGAATDASPAEPPEAAASSSRRASAPHRTRAVRPISPSTCRSHRRSGLWSERVERCGCDRRRRTRLRQRRRPAGAGRQAEAAEPLADLASREPAGAFREASPPLAASRPQEGTPPPPRRRARRRSFSLGVSRRARSSVMISLVSQSVIEGPPQLLHHAVEPGAGVALARADHGCDLGVREPGEVLERDQLALAPAERCHRLPRRRRSRSAAILAGSGSGRIGDSARRIRRRAAGAAAKLVEGGVAGDPEQPGPGASRAPASSCRRLRQARSNACEVTSSAAERSRSRPAT